MDLTDRVAVVTGGASGIGAAVVAALDAAGATPVVWDLAPDADGVACDVTDEASVAAALADTSKRHGVPTVLVASAGIGGFSQVVEMNVPEWRRVLDVNLTGTMLCLRAVGSAMVGGGRAGAMVAVSSIDGRAAERGMAAYCCSKAAVDMLVQVAAAELGPAGIRVNAVAPGVTDTPLFTGSAGLIPGYIDALSARTPMGRLGTPADVAGAVLALLTTDWVTGQSLAVDGGLSLPGPVDPMGAMGA
jgi:NAD(P)-dependent dehydrogenase (short-subunit alcohol dehydrogenase family)